MLSVFMYTVASRNEKHKPSMTKKTGSMVSWGELLTNHKGKCHKVQIKLVSRVAIVLGNLFISPGSRTPLQPISSSPPKRIFAGIKVRSDSTDCFKRLFWAPSISHGIERSMNGTISRKRYQSGLIDHLNSRFRKRRKLSLSDRGLIVIKGAMVGPRPPRMKKTMNRGCGIRIPAYDARSARMPQEDHEIK
jgi:hypothetical protein